MRAREMLRFHEESTRKAIRSPATRVVCGRPPRTCAHNILGSFFIRRRPTGLLGAGCPLPVRWFLKSAESPKNAGSSWACGPRLGDQSGALQLESRTEIVLKVMTAEEGA